MRRASRLFLVGAWSPTSWFEVTVLSAVAVVFGAALLVLPNPAQALVVAVSFFLFFQLTSRAVALFRRTRLVRAAARQAVRKAEPRAYLVPRSLPPMPELIVGRLAELTALREHLAALPPDHEPAVVVIHGQPGVGRTTLALRLAHLIADHYPDGQIYASLEPQDLTVPDDGGARALSAAVAVLVRALTTPQLAVPDDFERRAELYREHAENKRLLVVLDDAVDSSELRRLLPTGRGSAVIITSTRPLHHLPDAAEFEIGPLPEPDAIALLHKTVGTDVLRDRMARELVRSCDHHPLAIRLVALALTSYSGVDVNETVERLITPPDDRTPTPTLSGLLDGAYSTLTSDEQAALRCLGTMNRPVFAPWMFAAASRVDDHTCNVLVDRLTRAQLVTKLSGTSRRSSLYRLSPAVLGYARARAEVEDNEEAPARLARLREAFSHRRHRSSRLSRADDLAESGRLAEAITLARDEMFLAEDEDEHVAQAQANAVLAEFYAELGYLPDAREAIDFVLLHGDPLSKARAYRVCGKVAYRQRRLADARQDFDHALELTGGLDAPVEVARIHGERAIGCAKAADYVSAHADADRAVRICDAAGSADPLPVVRALQAKAAVYFYQEDPDQARAALDQAWALTTDEHVLSRAWVWQAKAMTEVTAGNAEPAAGHAKDGLELFVGMSHRYGAAHCRFALGRAFFTDKRYDLAIDEFREALTIFQDCGGDWIEGRTSLELASCHRFFDHHDTADRLEARATEIFTALGDYQLAVAAARGLTLPGLRRRTHNVDSVNY